MSRFTDIFLTNEQRPSNSFFRLCARDHSTIESDEFVAELAQYLELHIITSTSKPKNLVHHSNHVSSCFNQHYFYLFCAQTDLNSYKNTEHIQKTQQIIEDLDLDWVL